MEFVVEVGNSLRVDRHVRHRAFCAMTDTDMARKPQIGNTPKSMAARNLAWVDAASRLVC